MSAITTHILDLSLGRPARGVPVTLENKASNGWLVIAKSLTNDDGRVLDLLGPDFQLEVGTYRLVFDTETYFTALTSTSFYPEVSVVFKIENTEQHYHVPLLLSPFGYSTYRGS